jgi:hypothetical protein
MNNKIPIVIHHNGNQKYFQNCVEINAKYNDVIILGDHANADFTMIKNVYHVPNISLITPEYDKFANYFVNYSTNNAVYELTCFQRIFILREFMIRYKYKKVFFTDSDCILLVPLHHFLEQMPEISCALSIIKSDIKYDQAACVHNSILSVEFCNEFVKLCYDVYVNKSKFYLIKPKIDWHISQKLNGGVCDMTFYFMIYYYGYVKNIVDTNSLFLYDGEKCTFDHNINSKYGFEGEDTYEMLPNGIKVIIEKYGEYKYYALTHSGEKIRLLSIHYQGCAKSILENIDTSLFIPLEGKEKCVVADVTA